MIRGVTRGKHFLLRYQYVEGMQTKREPYLADHRAHSASHIPKGLKIGGPLGSPVTGAILLFEAERKVVEDFVVSDPYFKNSLIVQHTIEEYQPIINAYLKD